MNDITVSLEWAKKLRDAGFSQGFSGVFAPSSVETLEQIMPTKMNDIYFYWMDVRKDYTKGEPCPQVESVYCNYLMIAAAPTCEEILRDLPSWLIQQGRSSFLRIVPEQDGHGIDGWKLIYEPSDDPEKAIWQDEDTLANAAAAMWIYLKENKLLSD